jgi:autotransporter-associated beta strand protein
MMRVKLTFLCLMLLAMLSANVQGAAVFWVGFSSDFSDPLNWSTFSFPGTGDQALISSAYAGTSSSVADYPGAYAINPIAELWLGGNGGTGSLYQTSGTINVNNWVVVGQGYGGTNALPGGTGTLDLSGSAVFNHVAGGTGETHIAESSGGITTTGTLNLSGNAIYNNNYNRLYVGLNTGALGYVNISGTATLNLNNEWHQLGFTGGVAQITQNGGTVNHDMSDPPALDDGNGWSPNGHLIIGGWGGSGTYNMNAGALNSSAYIVLSDADAGFNNTYGILNLSGGTLTAPGIQAGFAWDSGAPTTGKVNFNGGLVKPNLSNPDFIHAFSSSATLTAVVQAGGANIDTAGYNIGINVPLLDGGGGGGLVKMGLGSLKLNAINTYTGLTDVMTGSLGGSGTLAGAVKVESGARIAPGDPATFTVGDITFNNGSYLDIALVAAVNDALNSTGTLTVGSNVALNVSLTIPVPGTYTILDWVHKSGNFSVNLPDVSGYGDGSWTISYSETATNGIITIVPEPATIVLLLMGALMLYWRRQR